MIYSNDKYISTSKTFRPFRQLLGGRLTKAVVVFTAANFLAACESVGTIPAYAGAEKVAFDYQQNFAETAGRLSISMPNGEFFTGKFVQGSTAVDDQGFDVSVDIEVGNDNSDGETVVLEKADTVSSLAEALLISVKGNTMSCRFQFSDPEDGIDGGGIGSCKVSDGRVVNATF